MNNLIQQWCIKLIKSDSNIVALQNVTLFQKKIVSFIHKKLSSTTIFKIDFLEQQINIL